MTGIVTELSRYIFPILLALYVFLNYRALAVKSDRSLRGICLTMSLIIYVVLSLGFLLIFLNNESFKYVIVYAALLLFFIAYETIFFALYPKASRLLLNNVLMLLALGMIMQFRLGMDKAVKQMIIMIVSAILMLAVPGIIRKMKVLARWSWFYGIVGILLLAVIWKLGSTSYGAQLSISVAGISFQASEFVKITLVLFTASMLRDEGQPKPVRIVLTSCIAAAHVLILVISRDLGSAVVYFMAYLLMLFVATEKIWLLLGGLGFGAGASVAAYYLFSHVRVRVAAWRNPLADYENTGYQISQSLFSISSGGWFGVGLFLGSPTMIPFVEEDFVFSAIAEEFGGIFAVCLIFLYLGLILHMMKIALNMKQKFYKIMSFGLGAVMATQIFMHIGGGIKLIPSTGITLPLISYGGSSLLSTFLIVGLLLGMSIMMKEDAEREVITDETQP